ncbi:cytochrome bd ubiquinol oxidase [Ceraceosorus bombacis]|uniref:Cytochrome b-c1 complex subunit 7 n=2 Tax=Ceraceosorus TaxID=401624 RepID=A0A0P1BMQ1_9BASI|nr:cytochrome bd ubiquinol oxidase [Ceraceosorus guamensis]PWN41960.1 cytochrome bd ubiquinol oxidase [Ceraceosorus guamensis]CEH17152.1 cytochrome bd ubiquinol oxidase [Ceraceosorus bombacis]
MTFLDGISLINFVKRSPVLLRALTPLAKAYAQSSGFRQLGLKYDDLLIEENDDVQKALKRLSPREQYDRAARLRAASQYSVLHRDASKEHWIKPEEDVRYLQPIVDQVKKAEEERAAWDTVKVDRK